MASPFSNLVNNFADGIHKIKCKSGHNNEKCKTHGIKYKDCERYLEYKSYKDDLIEHKCLCCNKNYKKKFDEKLKKIIGNPYKHFNNDINKFISLLRKGVCLYEYIHDWEKSDEASLPGKNFF